MTNLIRKYHTSPLIVHPAKPTKHSLRDGLFRPILASIVATNKQKMVINSTVYTIQITCLLMFSHTSENEL